MIEPVDLSEEVARLSRKLNRETRAREEAERLLEEKSEELYVAAKHARELAKAMGVARDGVAITDEEGLFTYMNAAHAGMFGYTIDELMGKSWPILYDAQVLDQFNTVIMPQFQSSGFWQGDTTGLHQSGTPVYQNISLTALEDGGLICASRDVSERRRRDSMILEMETRLQDAERSAAVAIVGNAITHDLNNIIAAISGYAFLMKSELDGESKLFVLAERILQASQQAVNVVESLKNDTDEEEVASVSVDIGELIHASLLIADGFCPKDITISQEMERDFTVLTNEILLSRCLLNVFKNAFEAMSGAGNIKIRVCQQLDTTFDQYALTESVGYFDDNYDCVIEVVDTGSGIDEKNPKEIFNPFFTTKKSRSQRGLGMQSLKSLADQDLAYVMVGSSPQKGTCIRIFLHSPEELLDTTTSTMEKSDDNRVVIVDDDLFVGEMLLQTLIKLGYNAEWFSDPTLALTSMSERDTQLLITDFNMPEMTGEELSQAVRRINPSIPIILYSGQAETIRKNPIYSAILKKPVSPEQLNLAIQNAIAG